MPSPPRIGVACPRPGERALFLEWLESEGFEPVPMTETGSIARELAGAGFEALIIDADLAVSGDTPLLLRGLGRNRPLIVIGETGASTLSEAARREVSYLSRPVGREELLLAIQLSLAEGRAARRSPRRLVARLQGAVDGVSASLLDVSYEGIRLELPDRNRSALPPFFNITVPMFDVTVVGQRVWVNRAVDRSCGALWCGVRLARNAARATTAWQALVEHAPSSMALSAEARSFF